MTNDFFNQLPNEKKAEIVEIYSPLFLDKQVNLFVKKEYLIHPYISGNKWRKLKYNISYFKNSHFHKILTFGGAFSNHIYATAAAGKIYHIPTIGIIRGERVSNHTLDFAENICGMKLIFVNRTLYKELTQNINHSFLDDYKECYILPEGGSNELAKNGTEEIITQNQIEYFSHICTCVGTGGTISGIIQAADNQSNILGFSVLKGIDWEQELQKFFSSKPLSNYTKWEIKNDYHFGGYAKKTIELEQFISDFEKQFKIPTEFVYTAKMFYGIIDLVKKDYFEPNSKILAIHSGGLR